MTNNLFDPSLNRSFVSDLLPSPEMPVEGRFQSGPFVPLHLLQEILIRTKDDVGPDPTFRDSFT